jgi:hypothetical protein
MKHLILALVVAGGLFAFSTTAQAGPSSVTSTATKSVAVHGWKGSFRFGGHGFRGHGFRGYGFRGYRGYGYGYRRWCYRPYCYRPYCWNNCW